MYFNRTESQFRRNVNLSTARARLMEKDDVDFMVQLRDDIGSSAR